MTAKRFTHDEIEALLAPYADDYKKLGVWQIAPDPDLKHDRQYLERAKANRESGYPNPHAVYWPRSSGKGPK